MHIVNRLFAKEPGEQPWILSQEGSTDSCFDHEGSSVQWTGLKGIDFEGMLLEQESWNSENLKV
jgi:hypothetical protein